MSEQNSAYQDCNDPTHIKSLSYNIAQNTEEISNSNLSDFIVD